MEFTVIFICSKKYDFTDSQSGRRVVGETAHCFDPNNDCIIKVSVNHPEKLSGIKFGDELDILAVPNGRFIKYEV